jgi:hypothetical protein
MWFLHLEIEECGESAGFETIARKFPFHDGADFAKSAITTHRTAEIDMAGA